MVEGAAEARLEQELLEQPGWLFGLAQLTKVDCCLNSTTNQAYWWCKPPRGKFLKAGKLEIYDCSWEISANQ